MERSDGRRCLRVLSIELPNAMTQLINHLRRSNHIIDAYVFQSAIALRLRTHPVESLRWRATLFEGNVPRYTVQRALRSASPTRLVRQPFSLYIRLEVEPCRLLLLGKKTVCRWTQHHHHRSTFSIIDWKHTYIPPILHRLIGWIFIFIFRSGSEVRVLLMPRTLEILDWFDVMSLSFEARLQIRFQLRKVLFPVFA